MDDKTLESLADQFKQIVLNTMMKSSSSPISQIEQLDRKTDSVDEMNGSEVPDESPEVSSSNASLETPEVSSDHEQNFTVLKKIFDLSSKFENLKQEHSVLVEEVKGITSDSFPGPEVYDTLRGLSNEHELLRKKFFQESSEHELLRKKFLQESSERKRLYNEVIELKGNIRVFCRCRPLSQNDVTNGSTSVVDFESCPDNELQVISSESSKKNFKFDHVFRPEDNQEAVFAQTLPVVTSVLDGYNVCIFAYGQTGTGKTYTMEGTPESRGVNYRTLEELFRISRDRSGIINYELSVSMLEVYNEKIRDLLVDNSNQPIKKLEIKQTAEGTQEVPGLIEASVHGTDEVWELLKSGSRVRSVGSTNANELSSRSHCLLRVSVKGENIVNGAKTKSHLWLVDLAGSERVGKIEVEGERLKESQFINKSLSALGDVISALASKSTHVPYRNSKLTHMLQSSLGGDCKTLMFVQISPSVTDVGETICSLNFATRVRGIESGPARKQADVTDLLKYKQQAEKQKHDEKEVKKLQDSLQCLQLRGAAREQTCRSLQEKVRDLEKQLTEERYLRLKQETKAFAAASAPSQKPAQNTVTEKPPLGPSRPRMPLRRITNILAVAPSPISKPHQQTNTTRFSFIPTVTREEKENKKSLLMQPRRNSIAVRPSHHPPNSTTSQFFLPKRRVSIASFRPESTASSSTKVNQFMQPKRRVSIATFRPDQSTSSSTKVNQFMQPKRRVSMTTFRPESNIPAPSYQNSGSKMGRQLFVRDPRKPRYSNLFSPMMPSVEATPTAMRSSSKFIGSPLMQQVGSWKPKHPTVIALQKKQLVWSPLKFRGLKSYKQ